MNIWNQPIYAASKQSRFMPAKRFSHWRQHVLPVINLLWIYTWQDAAYRQWPQWLCVLWSMNASAPSPTCSMAWMRCDAGVSRLCVDVLGAMSARVFCAFAADAANDARWMRFVCADNAPLIMWFLAGYATNAHTPTNTHNAHSTAACTWW